MSRAGELASVEELLRARGLEFVRERFRLPSRPHLSPSAGFLSCAAGAFLLAKGCAAASFLLAVAGAIILLLDAYGFSPLAWLGPREMRSVLIVPGTPSGEKKKALFFGFPLRCRLTETGYFSREEALRRAAFAGGSTSPSFSARFPQASSWWSYPPSPPSGSSRESRWSPSRPGNGCGPRRPR